MANTLSVLNGLLDVALRDTSDATWSSAEKDSLIEQAVAACPLRPLLHSDATIVLSSGTSHYALPSSVVAVSRLDVTDADGNEQGSTGGWETIGDPLTGTAELHVSPRIAALWDGGTASIIGYGRYDTDANLVPDEYVPFVIAHAKAAAYGAMLSDRARFRNWETSEQPLNMSVNELVQLANDAQLERDRERARIQRWRKPMPARLS